MAIPVVFWAQTVAMVAGIGIAPDVPLDIDMGAVQPVRATSEVARGTEVERDAPDSAPGSALDNMVAANAPTDHGDEAPAGEGASSPHPAQVACADATWRATSAARGAISREVLAETIRGVLFTGHMEVVAGLPAEYGWYVYRAARAEALDPKDLAAILISENSGPAMDFSFEGAASRPYTLDWDPEAEGSAGERGLFQISPFWAGKANVASDGLFDPETNARVAAFVVRTNQERHQECLERRYVYHTWIAHYKCAPDERDEIEGFCRFKQKKWHKLRASLDSFESPDFGALSRALDKAVEKVQRRAARDWRRSQRRAREREARRRQALQLEQAE